jgi:hypothetical protein
MKLITHLLPVVMVKMSGAIHILLHMPSWLAEAQLLVGWLPPTSPFR